LTKPDRQDKVQLPEEEWEDAEQKTQLKLKKLEQGVAVEMVAD
jgi:hypothetical protein